MSPRKSGPKLPNQLPERILAAAWKQIAEFGAPALSLRAIGRELNITAPAIYNYYSDRDALVTALIVDAFTALGDAQAAAISTIPAQEHSLRLRTLGMAYRQWAVSYPERYQLIFGTPIAGYSAPAEVTTPAAGRALAILIGVLAEAHAEGKLKSEPLIEPPAGLEAMFTAGQSASGLAAPAVLFLALTLWGMVHGLVSLEIGNQFPPFVTDAGEFYLQAVDRLIQQNLQ